MDKASDFFGELTFNKKVMRRKLSKTVYEKLMAAVEKGEDLDQNIAADVAHAMKEWALDNGATHFTHWFQPQRGGTAEKHTAFITFDSNSEVIERFSDKELIQSEPDASSFPSGGMRSTFEARGYTAWDPTSPAFLIKGGETKTLVIPSVFLSWTGHVLDIKTPFLRSKRAITKSALRLQKLLGNRLAKRIRINAGLEQEYFLVDETLFNKRPDLKVCDRTLFGAAPMKGQQMEDHYFGAIKEKVMKFMEDYDTELFKRGIPSKTRHNEVAPNQFEMAPIFEEANLAIDHNLQAMDILQRVAEKHQLVGVLHEKPFAGVNGSGKHVNWSIGDNTGANYFEPSKSPLKNINFLMTIGALMKGLNDYGHLLRASVADAGNDHRLGANEAPPAIISLYLGKELTDLMNEISGIGKITEQKIAHINLGVQHLPKIAKDISDRNRTSPIAFTGNKIEFRAAGSSQNGADAVTIINLLVAYGYDYIFKALQDQKGDMKANAIGVLKEIIKETEKIRFEGNGYSNEWVDEADSRNLPNAKNTPEALRFFLESNTIKLFEQYSVLSEKELRSKIEIKYEMYNKTKEMEFKTAINMVNTMILPALTKHIAQIGKAYSQLQNLGLDNPEIKNDLEKSSKLYETISLSSKKLENLIAESVKIESESDKAFFFVEKVITELDYLRTQVDEAETTVEDRLWPIAKYQDLLSELG